MSHSGMKQLNVGHFSEQFHADYCGFGFVGNIPSKIQEMRLNQRKTYVRKMSDENELNSQNNLAQK